MDWTANAHFRPLGALESGNSVAGEEIVGSVRATVSGAQGFGGTIWSPGIRRNNDALEADNDGHSPNVHVHVQNVDANTSISTGKRQLPRWAISGKDVVGLTTTMKARVEVETARIRAVGVESGPLICGRSLILGRDLGKAVWKEMRGRGTWKAEKKGFSGG